MTELSKTILAEFQVRKSEKRKAALRLGDGVCTLRRSAVFGWYMSRIHTARDTVLEEENIGLLRDGCLRLAAGSTADVASD